MLVKTSELSGVALDWAVAVCEGKYVAGFLVDWRNNRASKYSTSWAQGGPIIEREKIDLEWIGPERCRATYDWLDEQFYEGFGPTLLIAAMRCYAASKLGDNVEVPDELVKYGN